MTLPPPRSTLFPYTTLFRSALARVNTEFTMAIDADTTLAPDAIEKLLHALKESDVAAACGFVVPRDRKSTRLNSSHGYISYAVFCLKKKKKMECPIPHMIMT